MLESSFIRVLVFSRRAQEHLRQEEVERLQLSGPTETEDHKPDVIALPTSSNSSGEAKGDFREQVKALLPVPLQVQCSRLIWTQPGGRGFSSRQLLKSKFRYFLLSEWTKDDKSY